MVMRIRSAKQLGDAIRHHRRQTGQTQQALAQLSAVSQKTISNLENGSASIRMGTVFKILAAIEVDLAFNAARDGKQPEIEDIF